MVEIMVSMVVLLIMAGSLLALFSSLIGSATVAKRKSIAQTLATNQMEYLKSLPYDSLAVAGGSIIASNPLPSSSTQTINNLSYIIKTSINYIDDAYDGCGSYPTQALKLQYCRNYPPPSGAPATDQNPADYKIIHVSVTDPGNLNLAEVDTQVSARVAETASITGALFAQVIDHNGNPVSGATVQVVDNTLSPVVNVSDSTDSNGVAIFYGLPPDTNGFDYNVSGSKTDYSSLTTIIPSGILQPNFSNQKIFSQLSSFVTLTLKPQGPDSLVVEVVNTSGSPLSNAKVYVKGGYKKYSDSADTSYYFDNMSPADARQATDNDGLTSLSNLVPGQYIFCGDAGATSCSIGSTTYYLAAAVPYSGANPFNPVDVPTYQASSPPATTFPYNGNNFLQKVRLILTTSSNFPRIITLSPYDASLSGGTINAFSFQITGVNLPCSSSPASCDTTVEFTQGPSSYIASCTGSGSGVTLDCTVDLTGASVGNTQLVISANGYSLTLPGSPMLGGIIVSL